MRNQLRQYGFTLVELLVAMALGMLIMLAVGALFMSSRGNTSAQSAFARVQENGRMATEMLTTFTRNAGAREDVQKMPDEVFAADGGFAAGAVIQGSSTGEAGKPDEFMVRMQWGPSQHVTDCSGVELPPKSKPNDSGVLVLRFRVEEESLICHSSFDTKDYVIADNVINMKLRYGQDTTGVWPDKPAGTPNRYVTSGQVEDGGNWRQVTALRMCLTVASSPTENKLALEKQRYENCESVLKQDPKMDQAGDLRLYKNFMMSVNLRNGSAI